MSTPESRVVRCGAVVEDDECAVAAPAGNTTERVVDPVDLSSVRAVAACAASASLLAFVGAR